MTDIVKTTHIFIKANVSGRS